MKLTNAKLRQIARLQEYHGDLFYELLTVEQKIEQLRGKKIWRCLTCKRKMGLHFDGYCSTKCVEKEILNSIHRESSDVRIVIFTYHGNRNDYNIAIGYHLHKIKKLSDLKKFVRSRK